MINIWIWEIKPFEITNFRDHRSLKNQISMRGLSTLPLAVRDHGLYRLIDGHDLVLAARAVGTVRITIVVTVRF